MTRDCVCPCGENTAKVIYRLSAPIGRWAGRPVILGLIFSGRNDSCSQKCRAWLWRPLSHLSGRYRGICPRRNAAWCEADEIIITQRVRGFFYIWYFFLPNSTGPICALVSFCWSNSRGHKNRAEMLPAFRMGVRGPPYKDSLK
jgi:hypothetical protein